MPRKPLSVIFPWLRVLLLLLLAGVSAWTAHAKALHFFGVLAPDRVIAIDDFPGISGIAYWPERGTLVGVSGNGGVAELTLQGKVLRKRIHEHRGFEDIALQGRPDRALVIDAQHGRLDTLRLDDFEIVEQAAVPGGPSAVKGLAWSGNPPRLVLGNAFPPTLTLFRPNAEARERTVLFGAESVSSVIAGPDGELLLVSRDNGLLLLNADGSAAGGWWKPLQYRHMAGAAMVPGIGLVICAERNPGVLLVFSSIKDWPALRHALSS